MIKKIDIYMLKKFFTTIFFALFTMVLIYITIDLFDHLNHYLDAKMPLMGYIVLYTLKIPEIISRIFPIVVFMSLLFTLGDLSKYFEITALKSSGISLFRISLPFIIAGLFLTIFHFWFSEIVLPEASRKEKESKRFYLKKKSSMKRYRDQIIYREKNSIVYIKHYDSKTKTGKGISIQYIEHGKIAKRFDAEKIRWMHNTWIMSDISTRVFTADSTIYSTIENKRMKLDFSPKELKKVKLDPLEMSWFQLKKYVEKNRKLGLDMTKWEVERDSKISYSFITIILILIGIPLSSSNVRKSGSVNFGIAIGFAFVYYLFVIMFKNWGAVGTIPAFMGAWMPNIIFMVYGIFQFYKLRK